MSASTNIEWCDSTFNPWIGCTKVGPGCDHCYAEKATPSRTLGVVWGPKAERHRTSTANWMQPLRWEREHPEFFAQHGRRRRVFCASLADVFDNQVDPAWRQDLFRLIEATPHLDWLLVTKRIGNVPQMVMTANIGRFLLNEGFNHGLPANIWLGITVVNQEEADRDIPKLLAVPARVRFLSIEPMLGPIDLVYVDDGSGHRDVPREEWGPADDDDSPPGLWWNVLNGQRTIMHGGATGDWSRNDKAIDWVIVGGESGPQARPMHPDWPRSLRDQCTAAGVPFLFKQWGEWLPWHHFNDARVIDELEYTKFKTMEWDEDHWRDVGYPDCWDTKDGNVDDMQCMGRVGRKAAGRLLDGVEHNGFPEVPHA